MWVGLGCFVGANVRYALTLLIVSRLGPGFPIATLLINITGSLAAGLAMAVFTERLVVEPAWRLLLVVGFLGGYTTFSAYAAETLALVEAGQWNAALVYVLASNGLGLLGAGLGLLVGRAALR